MLPVREVRGDVPDGLVRVGDDLDCKDVIEEFRVKIPFARGRAGDDGLRRGVQPQLDRYLACRRPRVYETRLEPRQKRPGHVPVHEGDLLRVAD